MKLLLHICCAPCLIYPLEQLRKQGFEVEGLFFNPNVHPLSEYRARKQAVMDFSKDTRVTVTYPEYNPKEFFQAINQKEDKPTRCSICWKQRLLITAQTVKDKGYQYFSSTLLVSPYQDQEELKRIGQEVAKETAVEFYYEDFRQGFRDAHNLAKARSIYCQKYCGCIYSEVERYA